MIERLNWESARSSVQVRLGERSKRESQDRMKMKLSTKPEKTEGANFWIAEDDRHAIYAVRSELLGAALNLSTLVRQEPGRRGAEELRKLSFKSI